MRADKINEVAEDAANQQWVKDSWKKAEVLVADFLPRIDKLREQEDYLAVALTLVAVTDAFFKDGLASVVAEPNVDKILQLKNCKDTILKNLEMSTEYITSFEEDCLPKLEKIEGGIRKTQMVGAIREGVLDVKSV